VTHGNEESRCEEDDRQEDDRQEGCEEEVIPSTSCSSRRARGSNRRPVIMVPVNFETHPNFTSTVLAPAPTWAPKQQEPFPATAEGFFFYARMAGK
jgi:hypothetical protein